jgi:hypothetical protein
LAFIKEGEKIVTSKESGKRILGSTTGGKKGSAFFRQRMLWKMYGCKAAEKKEIEKACKKLGCQLLFSKEIILGQPCIPCAGLTRVTIRDRV